MVNCNLKGCNMKGCEFGVYPSISEGIGEVKSVKFSPDGKKLAIGDS